LPVIEITKIDKQNMEPGLHLMELLVANYGVFQTYLVMFDDAGDVRWLLDMSDVGHIVYTDLRSENGNWIFMDESLIIEVSESGEVLLLEPIKQFAGNHDFIQLAPDRLLLAGSRNDAKAFKRDGSEMVTKFDHVLEYDRNTNKVSKFWDLAENLDLDRIVFNPDYTPDPEADWFHINSIAYDTKEESIVASGRTQGVLKVDQENNLKWILAPHARWGRAGRFGEGFDITDYLLTAVDSMGNPFPKEIQHGLAGTDEFEWFTGQHSLNILENGNILLFDNGMSRDFIPVPTYSRAVEYEIDEENMTVRQVWQYGKERGFDLHSLITSNVDVLSETNNRLITAGNIRVNQDQPNAKMVEITYPENKVVFEAKVIFKDAKGTGEKSWAQFDLLFKGHRYPLFQE